MNFKKYLFITISISALFFSAGAIASAESGYVTADVLKVRSAPSTSATVIDRVSNGTELELLSFDGEWYKVQLSNGTEGYVSADYITLTAPGSSSATGYVTATVLKVRAYAGLDAPVVDRLIEGSSVELLSFDGAWYKVRLSNGTEGYVSADYISRTAQSAPSSTYGTVTADVLKVHSSAGLSTPVIAMLNNSTRVELVSLSDNWYQIKMSDGTTGFVSADYIAPDNTSYGYVDATLLNIRELPGIATNILTRLPMGAKVELLVYDGSWYKIKTSDGTIGYVSADYISQTPIDAAFVENAANGVTRSDSHPLPTDSTYSLGERIVADAKTFIGTPYVYAAAGPDSFDCSGFTMYIMNRSGIKLPHMASMQYTYGFEVSIDELIAGDLVFFNSSRSSGIEHVGIYIGNGSFIHASSGSVHAVTISNLEEDYYSAHYVGARRVID